MHSPIAFASLIALGSRVVNAWTPAVGDSWNYNLITPVKVNAEVDVVFIDMGKATLIPRTYIYLACPMLHDWLRWYPRGDWGHLRNV